MILHTDESSLHVNFLPALETLYELAAEGLAEEGYAVVDGFFIESETSRMRDSIRQWERDGYLRLAGTGAREGFSIDTSVRSDRICWLSPENAAPTERLALDRIEGLMAYLNRTCYLGLKDFEAHYATYPKGAFYERHLDQFVGRGHRCVSFVCYLNEQWANQDGGQLRLYLPEADGSERIVDVNPLGGRLACFRSEIVPHEVLVAHKPRHSLTGWMLDQLQSLSHIL